MKKILYTSLVLLLLLSFSSSSVFAAAPPEKDGVIFSGTTACGKKIALTFDDGPHPYKTMQILDLLDKFGVKANRAEVLFVDYFMEHLNIKGKAGFVVPEGIIFQSATAYKTLRKLMVEENYLFSSDLNKTLYLNEIIPIIEK